mmetsp:Transcript_26526/g.68156  ORF Transcript_26526/g.68156 Transcript_26526/m.68156 type:complete len:396 (-) Transcript_26526:310-1497(-)|eukprot:jgi/Tetstr1/441705/TSEL_029928.t1
MLHSSASGLLQPRGLLFLRQLLSPRATPRACYSYRPAALRCCVATAVPTPTPTPVAAATNSHRKPNSGISSRRGLGIAVEDMDVALLWVRPGVAGADWHGAAAAAAGATTRRLYAFFEVQGEPETAATLATVGLLAELYEAVAAEAPLLDVVPLVPSMGWTLGKVAAISELRSMVVAAPHGACQEGLLEELNRLRAAAGFGAVAQHSLADIADGVEPRGSSAASDVGLQGGDEAGGQLSFAHVAVGGTFDHLHAGHRLLLATAAAVASEKVWLGIASDALLAKKKNAELLEGYDVRVGAAVDFLQRVRPGIQVSPGPLTDPAEPPLAATMPEMGALVVSRETTSGAEWINGHRASLDLSPISVVVVGLIGADGQGPDAGKLSSSGIRAAQAAGGQ